MVTFPGIFRKALRGIACGVVAWMTVLVASPAAAAGSGQVLIIEDEKPAMDVLAAYLKDKGGLNVTVLEQAGAPAGDWSSYQAVMVYVHGRLQEPIEVKMLDYARKGGRLITIHHTISGGKVGNKYLFAAAGMSMPGGGTALATEPVQPGGHYAWREGIRQTIVNVNPNHYVTSHNITWPEKVSYTSSDSPAVEHEYPAYTTLTESYMNHFFTDGRDKTVLLGFKYLDDRNNALYMQDRAGWLKPLGAGWLINFQPGHFVDEFKHPVIAQMLLNAVTWDPGH